MGYVPADVKWFIAEIVEEVTVEGDVRNIVHVNFNLIRADSPEEAYTKATSLGASGETEYNNPQGRQVRIRFRGLRELQAVHEELRDGTELMFEQKVAVPPEAIATMLRPKDKLSVFSGWETPDFSQHPDYASAEVLNEVERQFGIKRFGKKDD